MEKGLDFYSRLVDRLLEAGVEPGGLPVSLGPAPEVVRSRRLAAPRECTDWFADYSSA